MTVGGAKMPKRSELPEELRPLRDYQAVAITTNGFRSDMAGLLNDIRAILGSSSRWPRVGAGLAAVVALAAGIWGATYLRPSFYPPPYASRPLIEIIKASTDRNELVELLRQYPAELPAIVTRLNELGYVQVVTETSGERWLKAGGGNEATERFNDCRANEIWCPEMVVLPAGKFMMGSTEGRPDEKPVHEVTIARPFAVG